MMMGGNIPSAPPPPPPMGAGSASIDSRSGLMDAIRKGGALKPAVETAKPEAERPDPRSNLLGEIQRGRNLKPVDPNDRRSAELPAQAPGGIAGALMAALQSRREAFESSDGKAKSSSSTS
jgi:hypothetical protein